MKRFVCLLLAVILAALTLSSCGARHLERLAAADVKLITALDAPYSSYMYVITDKDAIDEIVGMYNALTFEPLMDGEEKPDGLYIDKMYMLDFYSKELVDGVIDGKIADAWISPKGYILIDEGDSMATYRLTSDFDADRLGEILKQYDISKKW